MSEKKAVLRSGQTIAKRRLEQVEAFLRERYGREIAVEVEDDPSVKSGFVLEVGHEVFDWTGEARLRQLMEKWEKVPESSENYISLLREETRSFVPDPSAREIGRVVTVGDGIARISGLDQVRYSEIVLFECGIRGMVLDIGTDATGCIVLGDDTLIEEGSKVYRSGRTAGIPVGNVLIGRTVDPLGGALDGKGEIRGERYYPIERPAPAILDRKPVDRPLQTGILAIDSMFPIGRGQRELIIGDRQTGKTSIALDTILHQKGRDVVCVYVSIGQKASSVAKLSEVLRRYGALSYTVLVCAFAGDPAALQYLAPYAGTAVAEFFMDQGKDVLIVYDDLSKHAVAYRSLSLLLERFPGREAYPGDVFYLHSRLLERSAQLSSRLGGGSLTALPIVETQSGDISAYIPTNIISITDGQIFLESDLFHAGQRPAINVGLSVSRVGGAAQSAAMKKAAGTLRLMLAQYREMEVFTKFASDLEDSIKEQLAFGKGLMELLKQNRHHAIPEEDQVIALVMALNRALVHVPIPEINPAIRAMLEDFRREEPEVVREIKTEKRLSQDSTEKILAYAQRRLAQGDVLCRESVS